MDKRFGWLPDVPDKRDHILMLPVAAVPMPASLDLRPGMPAVYDQGDLGSCTAQAIATICQYAALRQKGEKLRNRTPSRLFIYFNERWLEGTIPYDSGAYLRDGFKAIHRWGLVTEGYWPYKIQKFAHLPPPSVYRRAEINIVSEYARVPQNLNSLKQALNQVGPVVFGFAVYESFMFYDKGVLAMPEYREEMLGGHAVVLAGYDDEKNAFLVRNSWSSEWGENGYFWMPYDYVTDPWLADDFWVVRFVS